VGDGSYSCDVPLSSIIVAAQLIFDDRKLTARSVEAYSRAYSETNLYSVQPTKNVRAASELQNYHTDTWVDILLPAARNLSVLVLAFTYAVDLEACSGLLSNYKIDILDNETLVRQIRAWDGKYPIVIQNEIWFDKLATLMIGHTDSITPEFLASTSLPSDRGWSVFME